jgi:predicted dehydrogenase
VIAISTRSGGKNSTIPSPQNFTKSEASTEDREMTLGVAILGTGRIGGSYINVVNAADGASVLVVAEPREEKVADLKAEHPEIEFVAGYQEILNRDDIDVVVGTLPH